MAVNRKSVWPFHEFYKKMTCDKPKLILNCCLEKMFYHLQIFLLYDAESTLVHCSMAGKGSGNFAPFAYDKKENQPPCC
jgi:hypothetical protein